MGKSPTFTDSGIRRLPAALKAAALQADTPQHAKHILSLTSCEVKAPEAIAAEMLARVEAAENPNAQMIADVHAAVRRMKAKGIVANTVQVSPSIWNHPKRRAWLEYECERLGMELRTRTL